MEFCISLGFDYVSCSPFRVPIARLAAAVRKAEGEPFEDTRKVYLPFLNRRLPTDGTTVFGLAGAARPGALKSFLAAISDSSEGQCLDYVGAEGNRIEIYFGKPLPDWVEAAARAGEL